MLPPLVRKLLFLQGAVALAAATLAALFGGSDDWRAALAGGGIVVGATALAARRAFSAKPGSSSEQILAALVRAEAFKFVFIAVAVLASVRLMNGGHLTLFATLFAVLLTNHVALLFISKVPK